VCVCVCVCVWGCVCVCVCVCVCACVCICVHIFENLGNIRTSTHQPVHTHTHIHANADKERYLVDSSLEIIFKKIGNIHITPLLIGVGWWLPSHTRIHIQSSTSGGKPTHECVCICAIVYVHTYRSVNMYLLQCTCLHRCACICESYVCKYARAPVCMHILALFIHT